jgi:putative tricarboxylic transport membrane protein
VGDILSNMGDGFGALAGWAPLVAIFCGVCMGILAGAMPGLSPSMGVALLVPFTYSMSPSLALILLVSIYIAANYGGSITAITINAPGTASAAATCLDGYPLTRKGRPGHALGMSLLASTVGGLIGTLMLIFFSAPLAAFALRCHPAEYFALAAFGLSTVASLGGKHAFKALLAVLLGLLLNTVGTDPISGVTRFTFGNANLYDGFSLIPALIGLFALSEVLTQIGAGRLDSERFDGSKTEWPTVRDYLAQKVNVLRSSIIGTVIGIFPGAGATIASFISYDVAKRFSQDGDSFGEGNLEGVAAAEAANSGSVGGALVPLLTLGIPGSASTAVLIGALMIHDLVPGPRLFDERPDLIYGIFASLFVANGVMLAVGLLGSRVWVKVTAIPKRVLYPLIMAVSVVGSFAVRSSTFDVVACLAFGVLGWYMRRHQYPVAPVVLGLVLGNIMETNFRRAVLMDGYGVFLERPVSAIVLGVALLSFVIPLTRQWRAARG